METTFTRLVQHQTPFSPVTLNTGLLKEQTELSVTLVLYCIIKAIKAACFSSGLVSFTCNPLISSVCFKEWLLVAFFQCNAVSARNDAFLSIKLSCLWLSSLPRGKGKQHLFRKGVCDVLVEPFHLPAQLFPVISRMMFMVEVRWHAPRVKLLRILSVLPLTKGCCEACRFPTRSSPVKSVISFFV